LTENHFDFLTAGGTITMLDAGTEILLEKERRMTDVLGREEG